MKAIISTCGKYRYTLERDFSDNNNPPLIFVMLNPSTADASVDDATIRRCMGFAKSNNAGGIVVVNLYAYRATKPHELFSAEDPVGPENDIYIKRVCKEHPQSLIVCAWGGVSAPDKFIRVRKFFKELYEVKDKDFVCKCLGTTKFHDPRHPLYLKNESILRDYFLV